MKQAAQEAYDNNNDPCIKTKSIASVYTTKREVSVVRSCIFKSSRMMAQKNIFSVIFPKSNLKKEEILKIDSTKVFKKISMVS